MALQLKKTFSPFTEQPAWRFRCAPDRAVREDPRGSSQLTVPRATRYLFPSPRVDPSGDAGPWRSDPTLLRSAGCRHTCACGTTHSPDTPIHARPRLLHDGSGTTHEFVGFLCDRKSHAEASPAYQLGLISRAVTDAGRSDWPTARGAKSIS